MITTLPRLFFILSSIHVACSPYISPLVALCCFLIFPNCFCVNVDNEYSSLVSHPCVQQLFLLLYIISLGLDVHCDMYFFLCVLKFRLTFLNPPPFVVCVDVATFRLHISAWRDLIWSSSCLSCIFKFPLVVVSYMNAALISDIADAKFMRASSISLCLIFFVILYPTAPSVCLSFSLSIYAF